MKLRHGLTVLVAAGLAVPALACVDQDATSNTSSSSKVVWRVAAGQDQDAFHESHSVQVSVEDGDITVIIDGEEIPADRIRQDGRRVVILDEDGDEIRSFGLGLGDHDWRWGFSFGPDGDEDGAWFGGREGPQFRFREGNVPFGNFWNQAGEHPPVMLGLTMSEPGPALRYHLGLDEGEATMVTGVYEGLPAHKAGLRQYDVIVAVDGDDAGPGLIRERLQDMEDGDRLRLSVISKGERRNVTLRVAEWDGDAMREAEYLGSAQAGPFGLTFDAAGPDFQFGGEGMRDVFISPDAGIFRRLPPNLDTEALRDRIEDAMREQGGAVREFRRRGGEDGGGGGDGRLGNLDDRMKELERMLDRLLERLDRDK